MCVCVCVCVYGATNVRNGRNWCRFFKERRANVHDEERGERQSLVADNLKKNMNGQFRETADSQFLNYVSIVFGQHDCRV
jgi:hypothetical protein